MPSNKTFILLFAFIEVLAFSGMKNCHCQDEIYFQRYTTKQGLINNDVLSINQDKYGFIWFGTTKGASRFDGMEFINYSGETNNTGTIGPGWVNAITRDNKGNLWFGLTGPKRSFVMYDYKNNLFINEIPKVANTLKQNNNNKLDFWHIFADSKGRIWLPQGIRYYNAESGNITTFNESGGIKYCMEDKLGNIWFATTGEGLYLYVDNKDTLLNYRHDANDPNSINSDICYSIFQDSDEDVWVGTHEGMSKCNTLNGNLILFERYFHNPKDKNTISNNIVYDINQDKGGNILIATLNGLSILNKSSNRIHQYYTDETNEESINSNLIRKIFRDKDDNIWIATNQGVARIKNKNFRTFSQSFHKNSISHNKIQHICEDNNKNIWIATPKGIDIFNRETGEFVFYTDLTKNSAQIIGSPIHLHPFINQGMYIATWNGGFSYIDFATKEVSNYINQSGVPSIANIFDIFVDNSKRVWIGSAGNGLCCYTPSTKSYKLFSHDDNNQKSLCYDAIRIVNQCTKGMIWAGTSNGLSVLLDEEKGIFSNFIDGYIINQVVEGIGDIYWIGTTRGLLRFNFKTKEFEKVVLINEHEYIFGILKENERNFWISTSEGLAKMSINTNTGYKITSFRKEEGIDVGDFLANSCWKLSDGSMAFGGSKGFCLFHPKEAQIDELPPATTLTDLKINNKIVKPGEEINGQVVLQQSIITIKSLLLNHRNNNFSIKFSGLQYNMPQYNQYAYRLEGYDNEPGKWNITHSNHRQAEYMNLPAGNYTFMVKASNCHGIWNPVPVSLKIQVLNPWWRTLWFIICCVIFIIILFWQIIRHRTYKLKKQKEKLEKIVDQRTMELKEMNVILNERKEELEQQMAQLAQMNQNVTDINNKLKISNKELELKTSQVESMAKQLHEADQSKLRFFANISHEFRTPLSLIIGPLEKCLSYNDDVDFKKIKNNYLRLMHKNATRLLKLINQVIDFRKMEQGMKSLKITNNNIIEFIREVVDAFEPMAEKKVIQLKVKSEELRVNSEEQSSQNSNSSLITQFWFDPDVMEKILYNLISNAIKYTPEGGEILISIGIVETRLIASLQNQLAIKISDTGIGIKTENLNKIFDRFYRVETLHATSLQTHSRAPVPENQPEGTGIGLAYTKELVELHKGTIEADSEVNKGTSFTLAFPFGRKCYSKVELHNPHTSVNLDYIKSMTENDDVKTEPGNEKFTNNYFEGDETKINKPIILVVEDNADLRIFIRQELGQMYNIYEAPDGEQGWEMALNLNPHLIISDIMMPVMDGIELCKRLKADENTSHIPVILLTAKSGDENIIQGLTSGAGDYITKPFNIDILKMKIQNIFTLREQVIKKFQKSTDTNTSEITHTSADEEFIQLAIKTVHENMQDTGFDNDAFVLKMNCSRSVCYRKIKSITGQSVSEFIRNIRLKKAAQLFLSGKSNVSEVSYEVGFKYPNYLSRYFTDMYGKSPIDFIKDSYNKNNKA